GHYTVNPRQLLSIRFRRAAKERFSLQCTPSAAAILSQPAVHGRAIDTQSTSNRLWALAVLTALTRTLTHRPARRMIWFPSVVLPHARNETYSPLRVKQYLLTYELINNRQVKTPIRRGSRRSLSMFRPRPCDRRYPEQRDKFPTPRAGIND